MAEKKKDTGQRPSRKGKGSGGAGTKKNTKQNPGQPPRTGVKPGSRRPAGTLTKQGAGQAGKSGAQAGKSGVKRGSGQSGKSGVKRGNGQPGKNGTKRGDGRAGGRPRAGKKAAGRQKNKTLLIVLTCLGIALAGTLGGIYIYKADYFSHHFYEGTRINGVDCSDMTVEEAEATIQKKINEYTLTIHERGGRTEALTAGQLRMEYLDDGKVHELMVQQDPWLWFVKLDGHKVFEVTAGFVYDVDGLSGLVDGLLCVTEYTAPADAYKAQEADGSWTIVPETEGSQVNRDQVYALIKEAIEGGKTEISLEDSGCYLKPAVYSSDEGLNAEVGRLNQIHSLTRANITLKLGTGGEPEALGRDVLSGWVLDDGAGNLSISREAAGNWVQELAGDSGIIGKKNFFRTTGGEILCLEKGDTTGWSLDVEKTADAVYQAVCEGYQGEIEPVYSRISSYTGEDVGGTYVEISIDQQKMWCYQNGVLVVETPVVTGNLSISGRATPKGGIWSVKWKAHPYHMKGPKQEDGSYEYEVDVDYWMPFNGDVGIHDLASRQEFGGSIYVTNGSHGCINTPYEAAKQIYGIVGKGTPVVVY